MRAGLLASAATLCLGGPVAAQTLPTGGTVAHGDVSIAQPAANAMTITQGTNSAVVNWDSFSIGSGAHVDIRQPGADASMLNRVTGSTTSAIHGRLTANGRVHLVNPNGIFIGPNGTVDAGAFVASTLDIADDDFLAGRLTYRGLGNSATVQNAGRVTIGQGGYAALLGGRVRNSGVVTVPMGRIAFGSGEQAVLDLSGDQFLQVAVPTGGEDGDVALIENSGLASAQGGLVEMRAATAREAVRQAINLSGVAEAQSVSMRGGTIILGGGAGGTVNVTGRISTRSAPSALIIDESPRPPKAPEITITGQRILLAGAEIDASGDEGGGLIRIGGDFGGDGVLPHADHVVVDESTTIRADSLDDGDGGRIAIWSDLSTDFAGYGSVRGGDAGGDGGFIEVSSKQTLSYSGLTDRRAPQGKWGMLLLDPLDIVVDPGAGVGNEIDIEGDLELGNVTLDTEDEGASDFGDITINADLDWSAATTLFLVADRDIAINGSIDAQAGGLDIDANGTITADGDIQVTTFFLGDGSWEQFDVDPVAGPLFSASDFHINQFSSSFLRTASSSGSEDFTQIFDIYGLQGIGTIDRSVVLINDIDGSGTENWTPFSSTGFQPIEGFTGSFFGAGFTVSNLFQDIEVEGPGPTGFFDTIDGDATISNLTLANADFTGRNGGILAIGNDGTVENVRVSGVLDTSGFDTGGMVGSNSGTISDSVADVTVLANGFGSPDANIGGFVGENTGTINRSHALGPVTVTNTDTATNVHVGGFVGREIAAFTINDSYATGDVTVTSNVGVNVNIAAGGFVGILDGSINRSFSTGAVSATGDASIIQGGFTGVAEGNAIATGNFWDVDTSGQASSVFATGLTTAQFQDTETFIGIADSLGWNFLTTWAPGDTGFYPVNYSTSPVIMADPDETSEQYGLTGGASTTGSVFGGPSSFVFDESGDTLDTSTLFDDLDISDETSVGSETFTLATTSLDSANGITYRVVDRTGDIEITEAPLTIIADDDTKTYGETFTPTNFTVSGTLFFSDSVDSVDLETDGGDADDPVDPGESSYSIFFGEGGASGTGLDNYDITFLNGDLTINPASLTITPTDQTKTFGSTFEFTGTEFTTSGFAVEGDSIDEIFFFSDGSPAEAEPGSYPILISGFDGTGLENYDITEGEGTMTVQAEEIIVPPPPVIIVVGFQNPRDTIEGEDFDGSGGTFGGSAVQSEGQGAAEAFAKVQDIAGSLDIAADACGQSSGDVGRYLACLSDALDDFASELDVISTELPPGMENVAQIVQTARRQIDASASRAAARLANATTEAERQAIRRDAANEARAALNAASTEIRKAITLVRAEDPELASLQRATITTVANAVDTVGIQLTRVTDL